MLYKLTMSMILLFKARAALRLERSEAVLTIFGVVLDNKRTVNNTKAVQTVSDRFELSAAHPYGESL